MAYKGGVPVNSGFYPRNDFPIADAKDIYVFDEQMGDMRLDEVLANLKTNVNNCTGTTEGITHNALLLSDIINTYILLVDYSALSFDTDEIVVDFTSNKAIVGTAILGQMILGQS